MDNKFNSIDFKIMDTLLESKDKLTISQLRDKINIAPINLWKHIKHLTNLGILNIPQTKRGKCKYPELNDREGVKLFFKAYNNLVI